MAKTRAPLDASTVDPDLMEAARKTANAKKARMLAEQELGIGDDSMGVVKGPAPKKNEQMVTFMIDLAPHSLELRVDGKIWRNGQTITVTEREAKSIMEMISRGWRHQEEIDGKTHNFYKSRQAVLSGANV